MQSRVLCDKGSEVLCELLEVARGMVREGINEELFMLYNNLPVWDLKGED